MRSLGNVLSAYLTGMLMNFMWGVRETSQG